MFRSFIAVIILALCNLYFFYSSLPYTNPIPILPIKKSEKIIIYGATTHYWKPFFFEDIIRETCSEDIAEYCQFTTNSKKKKVAKAWLYHNRDFQPGPLDKRNPEAVHVMLTNESPIHEKMLYPVDSIDWTMTYKRDSDIVIPYGIFIKNDSVKNLDFIWDMKSPNFTASWMVSHCFTSNRREMLILKAKDSGLQLDIYGKCFNGSKIPNCPKGGRNSERCAAARLQKYYFYFSFENSNCVDYVTEKFYNALQFYYAIPIVIKREIYTTLGIPPKSFIALDDFSSIQEMVNFLNNLKTNKTEYLSYHEWRKEHQVKQTPIQNGLCTLCQQLRNPDLKKRRKSYPDLKKWFSIADCHNQYAHKYWQSCLPLKK